MRLLRSLVKNEFSNHKIVKKERESYTSFALVPHAAKDTATVHAKCLVKMEKKLAMVLSTVSGIYLGLLGCILHTSGGLLYYICNFQEKFIHDLQAELVWEPLCPFRICFKTHAHFQDAYSANPECLRIYSPDWHSKGRTFPIDCLVQIL